MGNRGVEQFRFVRKSLEIGNRDSISLTEVRGEECFHNKKTISEAVIEWHVYLKHSIRAKDRVTEFILSLVEKRMLLPLARDRVSSNELVPLLQNILKRAEKSKPNTDYRIPAYFKIAFYAEQRKIAREWAERSKSDTNTAPGKSNRYKSTRFQQSLDTMPTAGDISDKPNIHAPLLTTMFSDGPQGGEITFRRWPAQSNNGRQELSVMTTGPPTAFVAQKQQAFPYGEPEDPEQFDFWDALKLLETQGWEYKSPLQRRTEAHSNNGTLATPSAPSTIGDHKGKRVERFTSITRTPSHKPHGSLSSSLRNLFKSRHENASAVQPSATIPSTLAIPRSVGAKPTTKPKPDQFKTALYDEFFKDRDVVRVTPIPLPSCGATRFF